MSSRIFITNYKWKKAPKLLLPDFDKLGYGYYISESRHPIYFSRDHKETVEVGFCVVEKIFLDKTLLFSIDLFYFFDGLSDEWISSYSTIPEEAWDQDHFPNILLISTLVIRPEFRGRHFGLLAIKEIVESCSEAEDIVTVLSHPIKDDSKRESKLII